jgi:hypothetical protein
LRRRYVSRELHVEAIRIAKRACVFQEKEAEEEESNAAESDKEKAKAVDDSVVEPVNDENAAPTSPDTPESPAEQANAGMASDGKSPDAPDASVTWVKVTENTAEAEAESS